MCPSRKGPECRVYFRWQGENEFLLGRVKDGKRVSYGIRGSGDLRLGTTMIVRVVEVVRVIVRGDGMV